MILILRYKLGSGDQGATDLFKTELQKLEIEYDHILAEDFRQ